ncbi:MAG: PIG-L family deacetylase [Anaerolineales bacterium]|jgi:LmbE family N-acetylglucosaminyl deacetylase
MEARKGTILTVLAHPDDESFGMGGTLALYAQRGMDVYLLCATRGEAGEIDPQYMDGFDSIAERRESELRCAAHQLGLAGTHFLDYRDSGMTGSEDNYHPQALIAAPPDEVANKVANYIRQIGPQVVLTFDPIGGYKHPDHIAIHNATVKAFDLASDPTYTSNLPPHQPKKLYYHVIPKGYLRFAVKVLPLLGKDPSRLGRNKDIDLTPLVKDGDFPIHAKINYRKVIQRKNAASLCHASQLDGASLRRGPLRWVQFLIRQNDHFMRAYPPAEPDSREADLFAGINRNGKTQQL